jgi:hypothetical protein
MILSTVFKFGMCIGHGRSFLMAFESKPKQFCVRDVCLWFATDVIATEIPCYAITLDDDKEEIELLDKLEEMFYLHSFNLIRLHIVYGPI